MATPQIKAFVVQEEDEGTGGVVFAKTNAQARRIGANEYGDGDFDSVVCRRAPWADEYVSIGHVPTRAYLQMGWYWECTGCEMRMSEDAEPPEGEPDWTINDVVEPSPGRPFHNQACLDSHRAYEAARTRCQDRAIDAFKRIVLKRFPEVHFAERTRGGLSQQHAFASKGANGRWRVSQIVVGFDFPGQKLGPAHLRYDQRSYQKREKPYFTCCNGDRDAFEAFAAPQPTPKGADRG